MRSWEWWAEKLAQEKTMRKTAILEEKEEISGKFPRYASDKNEF